MLYDVPRCRPHPGTKPSRRFCRPLIESLESRALLAFDLSISSVDATSNVSSVSANGTTTFTATADNAKLNVAAIEAELSAGKNVVIDNGSSLQGGNITTSGFASHTFNNDAGTTLTIQNGLGPGADIKLSGLLLRSQGTLIIDANQNVELTGNFNAATMSITASTGSINMPSGLLSATTLNLSAGGAIGTSAKPVLTSVSQLATDTAANDGNQFIAEANTLTALSLNAGSGDITLTVTAGAVSDLDASTDIVAASATVMLLDAASQNFGSGTQIVTSVNALSVSTAIGGGNQFISVVSQTVFVSDAGTGSITLVGGTFDLAAGNAIGDMSTVAVTSPAILNLANSDEAIGGLAGNGRVAFKADGASQTLTVGGNNQNTIFLGIVAGNDLVSGAPQDVFLKVGTGALTLGGHNSFTGEYDVSEGKLFVTGSLAPSIEALKVFANSVLGGTGSINRHVIVDGGHLAPCASCGVLSIRTILFMAGSGSTLDFEITSAAAGAFDQLKMFDIPPIIDTTGAGVALNIQALGTLDLHDGDEIKLIHTVNSDDPVQGHFAGVPEGANLGSNFLGSGLTAKITYLKDMALLLSPGSLFPWHNEAKPLDSVGGSTVEPDGNVSPGDALAIINYINSFNAGLIPSNAVIGLPFGFLDTNGDNNVAPDDALSVINAINSGLEGEGESTASHEQAVDFAGQDNRPLSANAQPLSNELVGLLALDVASQPKRRR